jgi:hypothetical protein
MALSRWASVTTVLIMLRRKRQNRKSWELWISGEYSEGTGFEPFLKSSGIFFAAVIEVSGDNS